jgi:hypothetical protein
MTASAPSITDWLLVALTGLYFVATAIYVCVTASTLKQIKRQADIAERALTHLERPWVLVEPANEPTGIANTPEELDSNTPLDETVLITVQFEVRVRGRSPAWILTDGIAAVWVPFPPPKNRAFPPQHETEDLPTTAILPRKRGHEGMRLVKLDPEQRQAILESRGAVMLYGLIRYRDSFENIHETSFCSLYLRPSLPTQWTPHGDYEGATGWDQSEWTLIDGPREYFRQT